MELKREQVQASSPITSTTTSPENPIFCRGVEPGTSLAGKNMEYLCELANERST